MSKAPTSATASQAQLEAGNYRKPKRNFQGLSISIENRKGSVRSGVTPDGHRWRTKMVCDYGYIRGSLGVDGDHVDCYIGQDQEADTAYIVHQRKAGKWTEFDEDKVMLGFPSESAAKAAYLKHCDDPRFLGPITAMPMDEFKRKVLATPDAPKMLKAILFFKAYRPHVGKVMDDLFSEETRVRAHTTKQGVFVPEHTARVKKRHEAPKAAKPTTKRERMTEVHADLFAEPVAPKPTFTPTHELADGTPVRATGEPWVYVDADGAEIEDNYAKPIAPKNARARAGVDSSTVDLPTGAGRSKLDSDSRSAGSLGAPRESSGAAQAGGADAKAQARKKLGRKPNARPIQAAPGAVPETAQAVVLGDQDGPASAVAGTVESAHQTETAAADAREPAGILAGAAGGDAGELGPKEGDRNAAGLVFHDGRWHREEAPEPAVPSATRDNSPKAERIRELEGWDKIEPKAREYDPENAVHKLGKQWVYESIHGMESSLYATKREAIEAARRHRQFILDSIDNPTAYRNIVSVLARKRLEVIEREMARGKSEMEAGAIARSEYPDWKEPTPVAAEPEPTPELEPESPALAELRAKIEDMGGKAKVGETMTGALKNLETRGRTLELVEKLAEGSGLPRETVLAELGVREVQKTRKPRASQPKQTEPAAAEPEGDFSDLDPASPNYRYRDTGYVAGSRKEEAVAQIREMAKRGERILPNQIDWEQIEQNPREAKNLIVKSNLFGKVDWAALREQGMAPSAGFLVDRVYAAIAPEPSEDSSQARQDYALGMQTLRDRLEACKTPKDVMSVLEELQDEYDGCVLNADETAEYEALGKVSNAIYRGRKAMEERRDLLHQKVMEFSGPIWTIQRKIGNRENRGWERDPKLDEELATLQAAEKAARDEYSALHSELKPKIDATLTAQIDVHRKMDAVKKAALLRNKTSNQLHRAWSIMGDRFVGVLRYRRHKGSDTFRDHLAAALAGKPSDWSWAEKEGATRAPSLGKEKARFQLRVAATTERIGGRTVPAESTAALKAAFGLRDVQSGNWVLEDPDAARFHVEQAAGAMADLADLLGVPDSDVAMHGRVAMSFGARGRGNAGWKGVARAHYEPVHRIVNLTKMGGGGCLGHELFHAIDNLMSEALTGKPSGEDVYASENPDLLPPGELRSAAEELRSAMLDGTERAAAAVKYTTKDVQTAKLNLDGVPRTEIGKKIVAAGDVHAAVQLIDAFFLPNGDGSPRAKKRALEWRRIAVAWYGANPEGGEIEVKAGPTMSSFAAEAAKLDGGGTDYYTKPREMAARAFQSWIEDRLAEKGRRSDYLSWGADNKYHVDPLFGIQWKPYPEGGERVRINAAFDKLVAAMREHGVMAKAFGLLAKSDSLHAVAARLVADRGGFTADDLAREHPHVDPDELHDTLFASDEYALEGDGQTWNTADNYLSGDLFGRIAHARALAGHVGMAPHAREKYRRQVERLKQAIGERA